MRSRNDDAPRLTRRNRAPWQALAKASWEEYRMQCGAVSAKGLAQSETHTWPAHRLCTRRGWALCRTRWECRAITGHHLHGEVSALRQ